MKKALFSLLASSFLLSGSAVFMISMGTAEAAVGGPTCNVPTDYSTIQAAVSVPGCTTVNVAAGTYPENVTITHTLTLEGAQYGNTVSGRTPEGVAESTVSGVANGTATITIEAANVKVDGFSITDSRPLFAATGIDVKSSGGSAVISHNIIDTVNSADTGPNGTAQAIYLETGPVGVSILNNQMSNIQSNLSAKGVLLGANHDTSAPNNTLIKDNVITKVTSTTKGAYGVSVANITGGTSGLQISNNSISSLNGGGWVHAIGIEGNAPSVSITGNTISNLTSPAPIAIWFENEDTSFGSGNVHNNNLNVPSTIYGIAVDPALSGGSVSGTCNWWNSSTGPTASSNPGGTGALVTPNVAYAPWLIAQAPAGKCVGGNVATEKAQCRDGGWKTVVRSDETTFKNQDQCIDYVVKHEHKISGDVKYNAYGLNRHAEFNMNTADTKKGTFEYSDANGSSYTVEVSNVKVSGNQGWFAGKVTKASNPSWVGMWLFAEVKDNHPDQIWGSFTNQATAQSGVTNMTNPADGPFNVTKGSLEVS